MIFIFFLILLAIPFILYIYYQRKLYTTKQQLILISKQFDNIRNEYRSTTLKNKNLSVKFIIPQVKIAITNINAPLYLAPIIDSPKLKTLTDKTEVVIIDSAIIDNSTWYYVSLPINTEYNSRGWINQRDFSILSSTASTNSILNSSYKF